MSTVRVDPSGPLKGTLVPPPDKSISHRMALLGAMSDTPVRIANYLEAEDTLSTLRAVAGARRARRAARRTRSSSAAPGCARRASPTARSTSATPAR